MHFEEPLIRSLLRLWLIKEFIQRDCDMFKELVHAEDKEKEEAALESRQREA